MYEYTVSFEASLPFDLYQDTIKQFFCVNYVV